MICLLWIWERRLSSTREQHLTESHRRLMRDREQLNSLITLVTDNTKAIERFNATQQQLLHLLEKLNGYERQGSADSQGNTDAQPTGNVGSHGSRD